LLAIAVTLLRIAVLILAVIENLTSARRQAAATAAV